MTSTTTDPAQLIDDLGARMAADLGPLTAALRQHMATRIAPLQGDAQLLQLLEASVESNIESLIHLLRYDIPVGESHAPAAAREYARRLAQRGIGVASLIRAYRLGQELVTAWAFEQLDAMGADPVVTLLAGRAFSELTFRYIDAISEQVVEEHEAERTRHQAQRNTMRVAMVEEIVAGRPVDVAVAEQALGHRLRQNHLALVAWSTQDDPSVNQVGHLEAAVDRLAQATGAGQTPLFVPRDRNLAWAWIPLGRDSPAATEGPPDLDASAIADDVRLAVGRAWSGADGFRTSHAEAQRAHRLAVAAGSHAAPLTSYDVADVRAAALLAPDLESARQLVGRTLGGLAVDTDTGRRLRTTLRAFLAHRGSYLATGETLHLHKNTVKYRVDKATQEIGRALDDDRLELELALVAADQLGAAVLTAP